MRPVLMRAVAFLLLTVSVWLGWTVLGGGTTAQEPQPIPAPELIAAYAPISGGSLRNLIYPNDFTSRGEAPLVDGTYAEPAAPGSATAITVRFERAALRRCGWNVSRRGRPAHRSRR